MVALRNPLLPLAFAFAGGVLAGQLTYFETRPLLWGCAVFVLALCISRFRRWYAVPAFLLFGIAWGQWMRPGQRPELDIANGELALLAGCVVEPPALSEGKEQFVLELEADARVQVTKYLRDNEPPPDVRYGQRIEVEARIRKPRNFGNPGAFDYEAYLARRQIYWTASIPAGGLPTILPGKCGQPVLAWLYRLRTATLLRIETLFAGNDYAIGVLEALLVGESAKLERNWSEEYRRTGTYHAIVVSGLHLTVIAAVLVVALRLLFFTRINAMLLAAVIAWTYAGVCGWQTPVLRSAAGFTLFAFGSWMFRETRLLNLLAAAALVFLAANPQQIWDGSFQLTFLSVLVLGALAAPALESTAEPFRKGLRYLREIPFDWHVAPKVAQFRVELRLVAETLHFLTRLPVRAGIPLIASMAWIAFWVWETFLISAAMQLGLALPMVLYFHRVSIAGLSANLIVTPLLTAAVPAGFLAVFTGWSWAASGTAALVAMARAATTWHTTWEPNWRVPDPPVYLSALFLLSLVALSLFRRRLLVIPPVAFLGLMLWSPFPPRSTPGELEITMIDVGQGDAILAGFPNGKWMLVDGGGFPVFGKRKLTARMDVGEEVVSPYLFSRGIRRIDVLVTTHQHEDHVGGVPALIENFRPRQIWSGATPESARWSEVHAAAARTGATVRFLRQGALEAFGTARVEVLGPSVDYVPRRGPSNNDSLVLCLRYGDHAFLLTGDAERAEEMGMLEHLGPVQVLKVSHHGSKTSTTESFLARTQPWIALISAGKDNMFRHPHPDVVRRLEAHETRIFRSDEWGLVTVRSDGRRLSIETNRWSTAGFGIPPGKIGR
ncbi:MAG: ComEC/Rec2 family competence protein [Candidatus Solibacter usitatus]|nr:ComEC/Rec2 family competence protein [Candidatus Solibacter usitatus]